MMYRAVCQPDEALGGGLLFACQQIHIFHPAGALGVLCMSVFAVYVANMRLLLKKMSILLRVILLMFTFRLV